MLIDLIAQQPLNQSDQDSFCEHCAVIVSGSSTSKCHLVSIYSEAGLSNFGSFVSKWSIVMMGRVLAASTCQILEVLP